MKNKNSSFKKIQVVLVVTFLVAISAFNIIEKMNNNYYRYKSHYEIELLEISAEYIGDSYKDYTALKGYELYKVEQRVKNHSSFNNLGIYVGMWEEGNDVTYNILKYKTEGTLSDYLQNAIRENETVIPAGMEAIQTTIVELPKGKLQTIFYDYSQEEVKEIKVKLVK